MADARPILAALLALTLASPALAQAQTVRAKSPPLQQIDAGPAVPVSPYFSYLLAGDEQPLTEVEFPIVSRLKPGRLKAAGKPVLEAKWLTQPIFLVGTDPASLAWLGRHADALRRMGAAGVVMAAPDARAFRRVQQLANANALPISPGPDHWLEEQLIGSRAAVLPVLIGLDGRVTQELAP